MVADIFWSVSSPVTVLTLQAKVKIFMPRFASGTELEDQTSNGDQVSVVLISTVLSLAMLMVRVLAFKITASMMEESWRLIRMDLQLSGKFLVTFPNE